MNKKWTMGFLSLTTAFALVACNDQQGDQKKGEQAKTTEQQNTNSDHMNMDHSSSGEVPTGLQEAKNPTFIIGSKAIMHTNHMPGMEGAKATIVGAYDTTVYAVSYKPTDGGKEVKNHKWVIQQEIKDADNKKFIKGDEVTIEADHMKGMKGAKGTIESSKDTTVYMVDYTPTTGGKEMKNHKWVTEDELAEE
ncbi:YdhK family protein [Rummeliibacillus sp. TYF-LIM-RU47]|uniref:YdhK family protein n=1 Tax=Rummeliibacillus sp. TYF-LIM-RU47 TaxID=2608406 RepID=UPI003519F004